MEFVSNEMKRKKRSKLQEERDLRKDSYGGSKIIYRIKESAKIKKRNRNKRNGVVRLLRMELIGP